MPADATTDREELTIGMLAQRAGCSSDTVRYYEREGLMPGVRRTPSGYRLYGDSHVRRLILIRRARELGFGLRRIRQMLDLADAQSTPCDGLHGLTTDHLAEVRRRIAELKALEAALLSVSAGCPCPRGSICPILEALEPGPAMPEGAVRR